jgi:hypothetical protein
MVYAGNWRNAVLLGAGALTFGGVGFGGLAGLRLGYHRLKETEALKANHPEQPWLWRRDWASGRIEDSTRVDLLGAWVFAAFWNLVAFPAGYLGLVAVLREHKPAGLIALLFPLVGLWLLARAVLASLRKQKYGISLLELSTIPAAAGRTLAGVVNAPAGLRPAQGFLVRLTSVRRVTTRTGKSSSTRETVLWQEEQRIQGRESRDYRGMRTSIPISFQIPADVESSDTSNSNNRVLWRLQVEASVPGIDYDASFEVPVFRTGSSGPSEKLQLDSPSAANALASYRQPAHSRITVSITRGRTEIVFPAARNPSAAAGMTVFLGIWWGLLAVEVYLKAPIIFPVVTGLFGLLLLIGTLDLWLLVQRVTAASGTLTLTSGYLVPGRERTIAAAEVADVGTAIGMQVGTSAYYDVIIRGKNGKKTVAGRSVHDKREAEWLAATIRNALAS